MRKSRLSLAVLLAAAFCAPHAQAFSLPFNDNFDGVTSSQLNSAPTGWTVYNGSVDQIALRDASFWRITCMGASGGCVDLDGSYPRGAGQAGVMVTSSSVNLLAGQTYQLSAYISGNQRISWLGPDVVKFGLLDPTTLPGTNPPTALATTTTAPINWDSPFTLYTLLYTPTINQAVSIYFLNYLGNDFVGPVIDNVSLVNLTAVPLPASVWLMLSGLLVLAVMARRRGQLGGKADDQALGALAH